MKSIILIFMLTISTMALSKHEPEVLVKYKKTARVGNLLTRWYYDLIGSSIVWKEQLILYSDSTYRYTYKGGECATFDQDVAGKWEMIDTILILNDEQQYRIVGNKLYLRETTEASNQSWVMKKAN